MSQITTVTRLDVATNRMICDHPFFASILFQHPIMIDDSIPTACVDAFGQIRCNPMFVEALEIDEIIFLLAHESMHYMYMHLLRRFQRDPKKWNIACDAVINETLKVSKVGRMPKDGVELKGAEHMTPEQVYAGMPDDPTEGNWPTGGLDSIGEDLDETGTEDMSQSEMEALEQEVVQRVLQARNAAKQVGNMPALLDQFVDSLVAVNTPWYSLLRPYFASFAKTDFSYDACDRRYVHQRMYLPTETGRGAGEIVWVNDESGSISQQEMDVAANHLNAILEDVRPEAFNVIHCAERTHRDVDRFEPDDYPVRLQARLSGGTDMPVGIAKAAELFPNAECIVVFTDGCTPWADARVAQGIPVIWCITSKQVAPWGDTIHVDLSL